MPGASAVLGNKRLRGLAKTGRDGVRATAGYYASAGKDERRLVYASIYTGVTAGVLWYVLIYYLASIGFSSEQIGLIYGPGSFASIVSYLLGGYLADKIGRKRVFLIGLFSTAAGLMLFLTEKNVFVFTSGYALTSIGSALAWPALTALMADKTTPEKMKYFYGVQGFANQMGLTVATFLALFGPTFLSQSHVLELSSGYTIVFLSTALISILPIIHVFRVTEAKARANERVLVHYDRRMRRIFLMYCLQNGLIGLGAAFVIPWFPVIFNRGMGASTEQIALIITLSNAVLAFGWFAIPKFSELRGSVALIAGSQIVSCVPLLLIPYSSSMLGVVAVLYTVRSFLMIVPTPVLYSYLMNIVSSRIRASFLALSQLAWQVPYSIALVIAGYSWGDDYSKVWPFYVSVTLYIVASVIFYVYFRNIREIEGAAPLPAPS